MEQRKPKVGEHVELWSSNCNLIGYGDICDVTATGIAFMNVWLDKTEHRVEVPFSEVEIEWSEYGNCWGGVWEPIGDKQSI